MKRAISVLLGDSATLVGTLRYDQQGARQSVGFEYDREWLSSAQRFALDPHLPLFPGMQFHRPGGREASIFPGAIADTEPDGWAKRIILREHAKRRATARNAATPTQPLNPIDFLLAVD